MFRPTDDACADCGSGSFAVTDVAVEEAAPLCFACYVDRVDRVRACTTVGVGDDGGQCFVVGAPSVAEAAEVADSVADELSVAGVRASAGDVVHLTEAPDALDFDAYHARELARGALSESRHVYAATSERGTVVDTETRTDDDTRETVGKALAEHVVDSRRIRKRRDVQDGVTGEFPALDEHRATRRLGVQRHAWRLAKRRGVSASSERALRNQDAGQEFEEHFADWCAERALKLHHGKRSLVRLYPEVADEVRRKTDGLAGVPDFFVRDDGQRSFDDEWRPDGDAFVEVKRGTSRLSREQERAVAHLKSHSFDVFVLRGEPEDLVFERR